MALAHNQPPARTHTRMYIYIVKVIDSRHRLTRRREGGQGNADDSGRREEAFLRGASGILDVKESRD